MKEGFEFEKKNSSGLHAIFKVKLAIGWAIPIVNAITGSYCVSPANFIVPSVTVHTQRHFPDPIPPFELAGTRLLTEQ